MLSAHQVKVGGEKVRLLKLRNPHGHVEWEGDWSDNSSKWTPKLRQELGSTVENDGIFFIALPDYAEHFRCTSINYVSSGDRPAKMSSLEYDFSG